MKNIKLNHVAASAVIKRLAESFETNWDENYGEYSLTLPDHNGKGFITGINFPNGIGLFQIDMKLNGDICLDFCFKEVHPFKFLYLIDGQINHQFHDEDSNHKISEGHSVILGANYKGGNKIYFPKDEQIKLVILDVDREKFVNQLTFPLKEMDPIYHEIFADTNAIRTLYHHTEYSLKMERLVNELDSFQQSGLERTSFHGAKALELLTYMLRLYKDDAEEESQQTVVRQADLKKIKEIVSFIDQQIEQVGNVDTLANMAGISEVKLQEGFKVLFNNSVHAYIQEKRLEQAMFLLRKTDKTISEIVYAVGLNSRSHFSKIFKEKYGAPPRTIRKKL